MMIFEVIGTILLAIFMSFVPFKFIDLVLEDKIKDKGNRTIVAIVITAILFLIAFGDNLQIFK